MRWMLTYTGKKFDPFNPDPELIDPDDIAHALSNLCRFNGHCHEFYSVAQHSCYVADLLPDELKLVGLLHDATEAYIGDMITPLKSEINQFREVEDRLWLAVALRFDLDPNLIDHPLLKKADLTMLATEKRDLLTDCDQSWAALSGIDPRSDLVIVAYNAVLARYIWVRRFETYSNLKVKGAA